MNRSVFKFPTPNEQFEWTGERYVSGLGGPIQHEHYHRYLFALRYCYGKAVLDVACGEGYGSYLLGQVAGSVIGIDIDRSVVVWANRQYLSERVSFREGDAKALPIDDQSIDVVVSFETIEHFSYHDEFVGEVKRVLRQGGLLIISSPNRPVYSGATASDNPFHVHELDRDEFTALLAPHFAYIKLFQQQPLSGSVIIGTDEETANGVERFDSPDGTLVERYVDVTQAMYFIAIASQAQLPEAVSSVFNSPRFHLDEIGLLEAQIQQLKRARAETQRAVDERGEKIAELERARAETQRVVDERGEKIAELERARADVQRVLNQHRDKIAELERAHGEAQRVVDERGEKIREQEARLESSEQGCSELARAAAEMTIRWETAQRTLLEREQIVLERDAIVASTLWQLTRPLRAIARLIPFGIRRFIRRTIRVVWWIVTFRSLKPRRKANRIVF